MLFILLYIFNLDIQPNEGGSQRQMNKIEPMFKASIMNIFILTMDKIVMQLEKEVIGEHKPT